jgi:hypothetical protein
MFHHVLTFPGEKAQPNHSSWLMRLTIGKVAALATQCMYFKGSTFSVLIEKMTSWSIGS